MAKDINMGNDIVPDTRIGFNNGIDSDLSNKLASEKGMDLNINNISKTDGKKRCFAKADIMYYVPPPPEFPAEVREIDSSLIPCVEFAESSDETNSNYWEERANNLNNYLEELGGATSQIQEDKNTRKENNETTAALDDSIFADHCDPPESKPADQEPDT